MIWPFNRRADPVAPPDPAADPDPLPRLAPRAVLHAKVAAETVLPGTPEGDGMLDRGRAAWLDLRAERDRFGELADWNVARFREITSRPTPIFPDPVLHARDISVSGPFLYTAEGFLDGVVNDSRTARQHRKYEEIHATLVARTRRRPVRGDPPFFFQGVKPNNFFHWTTESLPRLIWPLLAPEVIGTGPILLAGRDLPGFVTASLRAFFPGLEPRVERIEGRALRCDRLLYMTRGLFSVDWTTERDEADESLRGTRITASTQRFIAHVRATSDLIRPGQDLRLYVSRGDAPVRRLVNEADLLAALVPKGFQVLESSKLPFAEQVALFSRAEAVVGVHGAGLSNIMYCKPGARVLEITARQYIPRISYLDLAVAAGLDYAAAVADERGELVRVDVNTGNDLHLSPDAIRQIADLF